MCWHCGHELVPAFEERLEELLSKSRLERYSPKRLGRLRREAWLKNASIFLLNWNLCSSADRLKVWRELLDRRSYVGRRFAPHG
nr:Hypothetical protein SC2p1_00600 [Methylocystis sp. SC2]